MNHIKGHALTTERTGSQSLLHVPRCKCGWRGSAQRTADGARIEYRNHIAVVIIRATKAGSAA